MNIVIPMAGNDELAKEAGNLYAGNFIEIQRKPLFQWVYESLSCFDDSRFIFIVSQKDVARYHIDRSLKLIVPHCAVLHSPGETAGAACGVLLSMEYIDNDDELLICNGNQIIDADLPEAVNSFRDRGLDGGILTFKSVHPRWSYVKTDAEGLVVEAAEKTPISDRATAGCYWFRHGSDFVKGAKRMIVKDASVDGKFYICPVYNELVLEHKKVGCYEIDASKYFQFITTKEVSAFEQHLRCKR